MAEEKSVHEQVADLRERWNPAPEDDYIERIVGVPVEVGDTRATRAAGSDGLDHDRNPARDDIDAQRAFQDDGDDGDNGLLYGEALDDLSKAELQAQAEARGLSKSGNMEEIRERIDEHDESEDDESDDDE